MEEDTNIKDISWENFIDLIISLDRFCISTGSILLILVYILAVFKVTGFLDNVAYLGFSFLSLGLALLSVKLARKSDEKMDDIAFVTFKDIIDRFQQTVWKIRTFQRRDVPNIVQFNSARKGLVYSCSNYLGWADRLKSRVDSGEHEILADRLIELINLLPSRGNLQLIYEDARNLASTCNRVWKFDIKRETRDKIVEAFKEKIGDCINREIDAPELFENIANIITSIAPAGSLEELDKYDRLNIIVE